MIKGVIAVITVLLAVSGLCEIIHCVRSWLFAPKRPYNLFSVVYLSENRAISQLKFAREQYRWYGNDFSEYIIAVTDKISNNELEECFAQFDDSGVIFCPNNALPNVLNCLTKGK